MKTQTERMEFKGHTNEQGEVLWAVLPRSVKEGYLNAMGNAPKDDGGRTANLMILDLVSGWNFDDDEGKPLQLPRTIKLADFKDDTEEDRPRILDHRTESDGLTDISGGDRDSSWIPRSGHDKWEETRHAILAAVPTEVIAVMVRKTLTRGANVSERAEGF